MDLATVSKAPQSIDGVTPLRALVMQAYWALRRVRTPDLIGTPDIRFWIRANAPRAERPSDSLIRATLLAARLPRRANPASLRPGQGHCAQGADPLEGRAFAHTRTAPPPPRRSVAHRPTDSGRGT